LAAEAHLSGRKGVAAGAAIGAVGLHVDASRAAHRETVQTRARAAGTRFTGLARNAARTARCRARRPVPAPAAAIRRPCGTRAASVRAGLAYAAGMGAAA